MSRETIDALNQNTLIGFTEKRGKAWHWREGTDNHMEGELPLELVTSKLFDWRAVEGEITVTIMDENGVQSLTDAKRKAIVRSDTGQIFGYPTNGYTIHDYEDTLLTMAATITSGGLPISTAGVLGGGARAWVQYERPETLVGAEGVEFRPFLTAASSLDGSLATTFFNGATVTVCDNTLSIALSTATEKYKIRHSSNSGLKVGEARDALLLLDQTADEFAQEVSMLTSQYVTDAKWNEFIEAYVPKPKDAGRALTMAETKIADLNRLWNYDERVTPWKNSAYGVLAAVNTWGNHIQTVRGATRADRNMGKLIDGEFAKLDASVFKTLAKIS